MIGNYYYGTGRAPTAGIGVARMVGHVTYLSAESMHEKFARRLQDRDSYSFTLTEPDFAVESYLRHQAETFAGRLETETQTTVEILDAAGLDRRLESDESQNRACFRFASIHWAQ